jgi:hypothetical protein
MSRRLVAVLGYSNGSGALHQICAARLRRAEAETRDHDVVLLSGWARRRTSRSEAALMERAWSGPVATLIVLDDARSTFGNARAAAEAALSIGATEVVLVTSPWHQRRAAALFGAALRRTGIQLLLTPADDSGTRTEKLRELFCWALVPMQAALAGRRAATHGRRDTR